MSKFEWDLRLFFFSKKLRAGIRPLWALFFFFQIILSGAPEAAQSSVLKVVTSISILADWIKAIGQERVSVQSLIPPSQDLHDFHPSPNQARALYDSDLIILNGLGLDEWVRRLVAEAALKIPIVVASKEVLVRSRVHRGVVWVDPHAWQNMRYARTYIKNILAALSDRDPTHAAYFKNNAEDYLKNLDHAEKEMRLQLSAIPVRHRHLVTLHDSFGYFGEAYGFSLMSVLHDHESSHGNARNLAHVMTYIIDHKVPAIFLEDPSEAPVLQQISQETGAAMGGQLFSDHLSSPEGPAPNYLAMMRHNAEILRRALISPAVGK